MHFSGPRIYTYHVVSSTAYISQIHLRRAVSGRGDRLGAACVTDYTPLSQRSTAAAAVNLPWPGVEDQSPG